MTDKVRYPVRFAMVGAGMAAKPHVAALRELEASGVARLATVFRRDAALLAQTADALGVPAASGVEAIAADRGIDAVLLLTPPDARSGIIGLMARAGKPVLMEKPLERTTEAARAIVATMEAAGAPLGVVLQHRLKPATIRLGELLAEGRLGRIGLVRLDVPWWRDQGYYDAPGRGTLARDGGGVLISQAIHPLDVMTTLLGPVARVQAMAATTPLHVMETEDFATAGLAFVSGAVGAVTATTAAYPGGVEVLTIVGERATATLRGGGLVVSFRDGGEEVFGETQASGGGADPMAFDHGPHRAVIADFAAALAEGRAPAITGRSALAVHCLIDAILASARTGARVDVISEPGGR